VISMALPSAVVPVAAVPHVHVVAPDPVVAAVAPFMVPADPHESGAHTRMLLLDRRRRRLARTMDGRRLAPLRVGHRG